MLLKLTATELHSFTDMTLSFDIDVTLTFDAVFMHAEDVALCTTEEILL